MIDLGQSFDHIPALLREAWDQIHKVAPAMSEAIGQKGLNVFGHIAARGITHLDRWAQPRGPLLEQGSQILPGMFGTGKKESHAALPCHGKDPCGETAFSRSLIPRLDFLEVREDLHEGVIMVEEVALGGLPDQFVYRPDRSYRRLLSVISH